jgi:hypothetical protein
MSKVSRTRRLRIDALEDRAVPAYVAAPSFPVVAGTSNVHPVDVVAADFNGDGKADAATANAGGNSVSVLIGNGDGTFKAAVSYAVGTDPAAVKAIDVNRDGRLDLVTANRGNETVSVLVGNGNGTFKAAVHYAVPTDPVALASGDFNSDGKRDVAVACQGADSVTILLGNTAGTLSPGGSVTVGDAPTSVAVADFNDDGKPDLASVSGGFGHLDVNLNTSTGTGTPAFAPKVNYETGFCADSVVAGDFSGDGRPDLAVGNVFPSSGVSLLVGNPDGSFQPFAAFDAAAQDPTAIAAADLDEDGDLDLVTANDSFGNNSVSVLLGTGAASFAPGRSYAAGQAPVGVAVADFNGDGTPDVITANTGGQVGTVSVLLGNGNGTLKASPNLTVPGVGPLVAADFTADGKADLAVLTAGDFRGVAVFPSNGNGTFADPINSIPINSARALAARDLNGDGVTDLAVAADTGVRILLGNGDGSFLDGGSFAAGTPAWVAVDDFNNDGKRDLAVANNGGVGILPGNGDGTFGAMTVSAAGGATSTLTTGDFNNDGKRDLAATTSNGIAVLLGTGTGAFGAPTAYGAGAGIGQVAAGDFNGDGKHDLVVNSFIPPPGGPFGSAALVFQAGNNGNFSLRSQNLTDSNPHGLVAADLGGDAKPDLAVVNNFADTVTVHQNTGTGSFAAPARYIVGSRPTWVAAADFNGDGKTDLAVANSIASSVTLLQTPTAASAFRVKITPDTKAAGAVFGVTVTALDAGGNVANDFLGKVTFGSSDARALLPAAYTFTAADAGVKQFTVTLKTAGEQSLTVTSGGATGADSLTITPAAATRLSVVPAGTATAGSPFDVVVTALDQFGNVDPTFTRAVHLTTNDSGAAVSLPADYTFTEADAGVYTFSGVTLVTAGSRTVSAKPTTGSFTLASGTVAVVGAEATQFSVSSPATATAGVALPVTVTARDQYGNVATGFTGTVTLTSSDGQAGLPADYTFVAADNGVHVLDVTLKTAGPQSVTAGAAGLTAGTRDSITVVAGVASQLGFVQGPSNTFALTKIQPPVTVQVQDAFGNAVGANVTVKLAFQEKPANALLGGGTAKTNANGLATFPAVTVSKAAQGYTLVAKAGVGTSAPSAGFTVYKATKFGVVVSGPTQVEAGTVVTVTVTALAGTVADPTYRGTVHFTSTAGVLADLPADYTFTAADAGVKQFTVTVKKAGAQSVTVWDTLKPTAKGKANLTILAAAVTGFTLTGLPTMVTRNVVKSVTVTAVDQFGNAVKGYAGTVAFTNAGGTAVLPTPYQFKPTDLGKHVFKVTFQTAGTSQSLTVTDQADPLLTATTSGITVV